VSSPYYTPGAPPPPPPPPNTGTGTLGTYNTVMIAAIPRALQAAGIPGPVANILLQGIAAHCSPEMQAVLMDPVMGIQLVASLEAAKHLGDAPVSGIEKVAHAMASKLGKSITHLL
jgi:hypothetical protein